VQCVKLARAKPSGLMVQCQYGLTLVEMLVVVAVLGVLIGIGVPSFLSLMEQNRVTSAANQLQASLHFARSTAIVHIGCPINVSANKCHWRLFAEFVVFASVVVGDW